MKTPNAKFLSVVLVLVLILGVLPVTAFATTSSTFFIKNVSGYTCTGRGIIYDYEVASTLNATVNTSEPQIPSDACSAYTWVNAYNSAGKVIGTESKSGTTAAEARVACTNTYRIMCGYLFNEFNLNSHQLFAG